jgi:biotin transport system permease protein
VITGTYHDADSWLHRQRAGTKLAALAVLVIGILLLRNPLAISAAALAVIALYLSAGLRPVMLWRQVRPLRWVIVALVAFQTLTRGWELAIVVSGKLLLTVALAGLLTLTTRSTDLLDTLEGMMRRVPRINAERAALVLSLTIRAIPVVATLAAQVRDAQRARGLERSIRAYGVPLVVRSLRYSDALGEALIARGVDD